MKYIILTASLVYSLSLLANIPKVDPDKLRKEIDIFLTKVMTDKNRFLVHNDTAEVSKIYHDIKKNYETASVFLNSMEEYERLQVQRESSPLKYVSAEAKAEVIINRFKIEGDTFKVVTRVHTKLVTNQKSVEDNKTIVTEGIEYYKMTLKKIGNSFIILEDETAGPL